MYEQRLRNEALRLYRRYAIEVVEALSLCPWAKRARLDRRVQPVVIVDRSPSPDDVLPYILEIAADPNLDIGLLLFPRVELNRQEFHRFVAEVRECDELHHERGETPFFMADFHPMAELDMSNPARLVSFIRRTPDPTIQLVRRGPLNEARRAVDEGTVAHTGAILSSVADAAGLPIVHSDRRPVHEKVAEVNHNTISRLGPERLRAILDDIRRDRNQSYERLAREAALPAHQLPSR